MNYDTDIVCESIEESLHMIFGKDVASNKYETHEFKTFSAKFTRYYFKNSLLVKYRYIDSQEHIGILLSKDLYWDSFKAMYNILSSTHEILRVDRDMKVL